MSPEHGQQEGQPLEALELDAGSLEENTTYLEAVRDRLDTITERIDLILSAAYRWSRASHAPVP